MLRVLVLGLTLVWVAAPLGAQPVFRSGIDLVHFGVTVLDQKLHVQAGQQDLVQGPDDQLILADGETPHDGLSVPPTGRAGSTGGSSLNYTTYDIRRCRAPR